jgi:ParB-like chromosome segregation protein Spo0J
MSNREVNSITAIEPIPGMPRMEIVYKPIGWFKEYFRNPRKNDIAVDRMCASIREFGFAVAMLGRSTGEIVDGHLRYKGARKVGLTELPVVLCDHWTLAQVKAFRLMVNRSVTWADWDDELLSLELLDLKDLDFDVGLTGFDDQELKELLAAHAAAQGLTDEDAAPAAPQTPISVAGDLWLLGRHRLLCGDATSPQVVSRLMGGVKPILMVTDPPYGVSYDPEWRKLAGINNSNRMG